MIVPVWESNSSSSDLAAMRNVPRARFLESAQWRWLHSHSRWYSLAFRLRVILPGARLITGDLDFREIAHKFRSLRLRSRWSTSTRADRYCDHVPGVSSSPRRADLNFIQPHLLQVTPAKAAAARSTSSFAAFAAVWARRSAACFWRCTRSSRPTRPV